MRASEIFEVEADRRFLGRRIAQRVDEFWDQAADHPQETVAAAQALYRWLQSHQMTGVADLQRKQLLREIYDFIHFMRS